MNLKIINIIIFISIAIVIYSCTRDELFNPNPPVIKTTIGAYILSEGGFSQNSSKLSFYSIPMDTLFQNIFSPGNLGLFSSGMILKDNYLYVLEQGNYGAAGKIYKLDTTGKVLNSAIVGINPYSLAIANNKIYITNGPASNVSVLNQNDFSLIKNINVGAYPQEILSYGNNIYVCNTSIYGGTQDSSVSVIDANSDLVVSTIWVHKDPSSITLSRDNRILIGCPGSNGMIFIINPATFAKTDSINLIEGFGKDLSVDVQSDNAYFISNANNIVRLNLTDKTNITIIQNQNPAVSFFYGYSFDYKNRKHYICDARNFLTNGYFMVLNFDNYLEKNFSTGISPRRIVLKSN